MNLGVETPKRALRRSYVFLRLLKSAGLDYALKSATHGQGACEADEVHLREAMRWLCRAEDITQGRGVSKKYQLFNGWDPYPYPETTGYILETFLRYWKLTGDREYYDRALRMGQWEIEIQAPSGGVIGDLRNPESLRVFNTGQVLHGWCSLFEETKNQVFLDAAVRAGNYLAAIQETDGSWIKDSLYGAKTYDARVSWSLLRLAILAKAPVHAETAIRNLDWALRQQQPNGWWKNCGFHDADPITHLISYTIRGFLESHLLLKKHPALVPGADKSRIEAYRAAALTAAAALAERVQNRPALGIKGLPQASYDADWTSRDDHSCLTGNVQFAGILYIIDQNYGKPDYHELADSIVATAKTMQDITTHIEGIRGGFPGPFPIYKGYDAFSFLNWATKFFADVLIARLEQVRGRETTGRR